MKCYIKIELFFAYPKTVLMILFYKVLIIFLTLGGVDKMTR